MDRRKFLKGLVGTAAAYGTSGLFTSNMVLAESVCSGPPRFFVLVNLDGGADGHFEFPFIDERKAIMDSLRGPIAVPETNMIDLGVSEIALHTALQPLYAAHASSDMKLIAGVGFPNQSLSHYKAQKCYRIMTCGPGRQPGLDWKT